MNSTLIDDTKVEITRPMCIIPARKGSKRLKNKNKLLLNGKPLVSYALEAAIESKLFQMIVVSSDDMDILEIAFSHFLTEIVQPNKRPKVLCGDKVPVKVVVRFISQIYRSPEVLCLIQPTNPLITAKQIRKAYKVFKKKDANYLIGVCKGKDIGFHFMKRDVFLREYDKDFYGTNWIPFEMKGVDIDTIEDFKEAERLLL